ncbi:hypothetical protein CC1G_02457 [Coprinopsis cinerea okayama7|uniref:Uncharacterized protein n=1 Tax=Coprinopsis cinerea (strain Okayama-7 / 130 / ATCC MYA-4618 / FGSC 9003) TaxID=240176 RepID=A8NBJ7_COPC7|nr:hypothetical protein CC1G_02457 [Coprinopsis cinerea okayama7\|eukprot:XP_001832195.2 hypothetical protein CC1G_02457 [Coprinopsis cinerea okayama7\
MSRPKKYRTKKELKQANRDKNRRYYERNKVEINKRRRDKRSGKANRGAARGKETVPKDRESVETNTCQRDVDAQDLERTVVMAKEVYQGYLRMIGRDGVKFMQSLCRQVLALFNNGEGARHVRDYVSRQSSKFDPWRRKIVELHGEVLQFRGVKDVIAQLDRFLQDIDRVQGWVDDLETYLFTGADEFTQAYANNELLFQRT